MEDMLEQKAKRDDIAHRPLGWPPLPLPLPGAGAGAGANGLGRP